ncbi:MAG TPA: glycosyltransferase family 1 protein [Bryobacteraceae bacterium]|nr:glycosyltransferase family 1 protein [Bryobacteraceae bacterium]
MNLRVALDATPLTLSSGGLRRYVVELSLALARTFPRDHFILASDQPFELPEGAPPNLVRGPGPCNALERRWWSYGLARLIARERIDVFHGMNFEVPLAPLVPSVLTLHDLSPWREREWHSGAERVRARTPRLLGLGLATMVIVPTRAIRGEAIERFRLAPGRIEAIPEAAPPAFQPVPGAGPRTPYFLYVGALEPRKNLPVILDSWHAVRNHHEVDLVLAGLRRSDYPAPPAEPGLHLAGEVPEAELPRLYSGALAFLYPSFYEGFGLPVLEAMQCGAAVFVSRDAALAEVAGDAAVALPACEPSAWVEAMARALTDPEWVRELRARSLARAQEFSWERAARRTREVYAEAIRRFGA